jgi:hypothetical protein
MERGDSEREEIGHHRIDRVFAMQLSLFLVMHRELLIMSTRSYYCSCHRSAKHRSSIESKSKGRVTRWGLEAGLFARLDIFPTELEDQRREKF